MVMIMTPITKCDNNATTMPTNADEKKQTLGETITFTHTNKYGNTLTGHVTLIFQGSLRSTREN